MLVFADVGGLEDYYALFQHFGFGGTAASWAEHLETIVEEHCPALLDELEFTESGTADSWVEHIETIIEEHRPQLLDELEFAEGGHTFIVYVASQDIADQFFECVLPFFDTLPHLQKYLSQADPDDFFA